MCPEGSFAKEEKSRHPVAAPDTMASRIHFIGPLHCRALSVSVANPKNGLAGSFTCGMYKTVRLRPLLESPAPGPVQVVIIISVFWVSDVMLARLRDQAGNRHRRWQDPLERMHGSVFEQLNFRRTNYQAESGRPGEVVHSTIGSGPVIHDTAEAAEALVAGKTESSNTNGPGNH